MRFYFRLCLLLSCLLAVSVCLTSCKDKKLGKVVITEKEFSTVKDGKFSYSLNVTGKVKNVGTADVKNIVITGYCKSCKEVMISNTWYVTQVVKTEDQKTTIAYLPVGAEEPFAFNGIAYYYSQSSEPPQGMPEKLDVVIESFQTVE